MSDAIRASTWESASDVVLANGSKLLTVREIAAATRLPQYVFTHRQVRESLGVPHRRISQQVRFDLEEVMAWVNRWLSAPIEY